MTPKKRLSCLGIDVGKQTDHSANVMAEGFADRDSRSIKAAGRMQLGVDYDKQIDIWVSMSSYADMTLVDAGGPGWPVIDVMRRRGAQNVWAVAITSGKNVRVVRDLKTVFVPKASLIGMVVVAMEKDQLDITNELASIFDEIRHFEATTTPSGNVKYEAAEGHDDLVLALALSLLGFHIERLSGR